MVKKQTEPYLATYLHQRGYAQGIPISGVFELTGRCNFSCPMCYVHDTGENREGRELTAEQWLDIAREARDMGMVFALLTGGEPLLRKDFFQIYRGMKELGLMVSINSNGSLLHGEILEQLLLDPPTRINISLYGGCPETYRKMCGVDAYHRVTENIRQLKAAGVDVSLNLSITPYNKDDLARIRADAARLDVPVRSSGYMYPQVRVKGDHQSRLSPVDAARYELEWEKLYYGEEAMLERTRELQMWLDEGCPRNPGSDGEKVSCRAGTTSFWITWEGKMMPCGMVTEPGAYPLEQGFGEAWQQIRRETAAIRMPAACAGCDKRNACGVCAAVCKTETGHFHGIPSYMCEKTAEKIRLLQGTGDARKEV